MKRNRLTKLKEWIGMTNGIKILSHSCSRHVFRFQMPASQVDSASARPDAQQQSHLNEHTLEDSYIVNMVRKLSGKWLGVLSKLCLETAKCQ